MIFYRRNTKVEERIEIISEEIKARIQDYQYYIRRYSSTVLSNKEDREELIGLANKGRRMRSDQ